MNQSEKLATKSKIIKEARILFSQLGFNGTSVRMIAEKSEVNLAAINYHFGSKEELFWGVLDESLMWIEESVKKVVADSKNIEEFAIKLFNHLYENSHFVVPTLKTILSDLTPPSDNSFPYCNKMQEAQFGPPGTDQLIKFLKNVYPQMSEEAGRWLAGCLFSSIVHMASVTSSCQYKTFKDQAHPRQCIEGQLGRMASALIQYGMDDSNWSLDL